MPPRKSTAEEVKEEVAKDLSEELIHKNMRFYGQVQDTPKEAQREIGAGRLKGYTDINPMWRIKKLTEIYGPCGFGWWTQNEKYMFEECAATNEVAVFCTLELVVVDPETDLESHPISGVGGNKFVAKEKNGPYCNDEALKMAYTDALSIACKSLGFSHDIYFSRDRTKYSLPEDEMNSGANNEPTPEDFKAITDRIQKGINLVTKDMDKEAKDKFMQDFVAKHIGSVNYMTCKDMSKLNTLLNELLALAKKSA